MNDDVSERLQGLESHTAGLDARLSGVERTLSTHGGKLDRIVDAIATQSAQPRFDPIIIVGFIKDIAILFGLICAGIIYVASAQTNATTAVLEQRVITLETKGQTK
jgi:hypothetical protein